MMMVRCYLGPSEIEGLGVFTTQPIKKGGLVWLYDERFDVSYYRDDIERAPKHFREFLERYTYEHPENPDCVVLDCDEGRFMNHSTTPNTDFRGMSEGFALVDIPAGTEITCNYAEFDDDLTMQPPRHAVHAA